MTMLEKLQKEFDDALASMTPSDWAALNNINEATASRQADLLLKARIQAYKIKMEAQPASIFSVRSIQSHNQPSSMTSIQGGVPLADFNQPTSSDLFGNYAMAA